MSPTVPKFHVHQDDKMVYLDINVPYVRVSDMEFFIDGCDFTFWCKPYLLKLQFPGNIIDDEATKAVYDMNLDHGTIHVHISKQNAGEHFPDLDMVTKLLQKKKWQPQDEGLPIPGPLIEVLGSSQHSDEEDEPIHEDKSIKTDNSLLVLEQKQQEPLIQLPGTTCRYGFNNSFRDFFKCWHSEVCEIISLPEPDQTAENDRRRLREEEENIAFDVERYLGDFKFISDDMLYQEAVQFCPYWEEIQRNQDIWHRKVNTLVRNRVLIRSLTPIPEDEEIITQRLHGLDLDQDNNVSAIDDSRQVVFSPEDTQVLAKLPNKEYLISRGSKEERRVLCSMVDILIGFAYDNRMTQGDSTIESGWTVSIISPTLSWLDASSTDMDQIINNGVRRMLTYPYIRHYEFSKLVLEDCLNILRLGRRCIIRCFLQLYRIFEKSETQYLLRNLYIEDYCVWLQHFDQDQVFEELADEFETALRRHRKSQVGWDLDEIETWIEDVEEEE